MDLVPLGVPAIPVLCSVGFPSQMLYLQEKKEHKSLATQEPGLMHSSSVTKNPGASITKTEIPSPQKTQDRDPKSVAISQLYWLNLLYFY